jgi:hypothetical protein
MDLTIADNDIFDNNTRSLVTNGANILLSYPQGLQIASNKVRYPVAGYNIYILGAVDATNDLISGNTLTGASLGPIYLDSALPASVIVQDNIGITDLSPTIAAATTFVFPLSPNFTISGSVPVAMTAATLGNVTVNSSGTFRCTGTGNTIVASGGWGNGGTCTQNVLFNWHYDGTSVWWK